jgi:glycosyltransferase involved in cell wall biosynthesis
MANEQNSGRVLPKVTIGITCFNAKDTIARAVDSALQQEWADKEIIIVDDASTDGSRAVIESLRSQCNDIVSLRHDSNMGYPAALNTIVEAATGDLIALFDDDDVSDPQRLRDQWARLKDYENKTGAPLVLCYGNRSVVRIGDTNPQHVTKALGRVAREPYGLAVADYVLGVCRDPSFVWGLFGSCTLMARKSTLIEIGAFDTAFRRSAEFDFAVRAALLGAHFIAVDKPIITQFKTPGQEKSGVNRLKYALLLREKHRSYLVAKKAYWGSIARAYANHYGTGGRRFRAFTYRVLAVALSPTTFAGLVRRRIAAVASRFEGLSSS